MKSLFFLLCFPIFVNAQSQKPNYYFNHLIIGTKENTFKYETFIDSIPDGKFSFSQTTLPISETASEILYSNSIYLLKDSSEIQITKTYQNNNLEQIIFKHINLKAKFQKIFTNGELKITKNIHSIDTIQLSNHQGEDSILIFDTIYRFEANGLWKIKLDENHFEFGNFINGKKEGIWKTCFVSEVKSTASIVTKEILFEKDSLVKIKNYSLLETESEKTINTIIKGEWESIPTDFISSIFTYYTTVNIPFYRKSGEKSTPNHFKFDFKKGNTFEFNIITQGCGTLPYEDNRTFGKYVNTNNELTLPPFDAKIIFLSKDVLVVQFAGRN